MPLHDSVVPFVTREIRRQGCCFLVSPGQKRASLRAAIFLSHHTKPCGLQKWLPTEKSNDIASDSGDSLVPDVAQI